MNHLQVTACPWPGLKPRSGVISFREEIEKKRCLCARVPKGKYAATRLQHFDQDDRARLFFFQVFAQKPVPGTWLQDVAHHFAWLALVPNGQKIFGVGLLLPFDDGDEGPVHLESRLQLPLGLRQLLHDIGARGRPVRSVNGHDCMALGRSILARWRTARMYAPSVPVFVTGDFGHLLAREIVTEEHRREHFARKAKPEDECLAEREKYNAERRALRQKGRVGHRCADCAADVQPPSKGPVPRRCPTCAATHKTALQAARRAKKEPDARKGPATETKRAPGSELSGEPTTDPRSIT